MHQWPGRATGASDHARHVLHMRDWQTAQVPGDHSPAKEPDRRASRRPEVCKGTGSVSEQYERWAATTGRGLEEEVNGWMRKAQGLEQKISDLEDRLDAAERALKQARQIADDAIATIRRGSMTQAEIEEFEDFTVVPAAREGSELDLDGSASSIKGQVKLNDHDSFPTPGETSFGSWDYQLDSLLG